MSGFDVGWHLEQPPASSFEANDAGILKPPQFLEDLKLLDFLPLTSQRIAQFGGGLWAGSEGKDVEQRVSHRLGLLPHHLRRAARLAASRLLKLRSRAIRLRARQVSSAPEADACSLPDEEPG